MNIETRKLTVNITESTAADAARISELIDKLEQDHSLTRSEWTELIRDEVPRQPSISLSGQETSASTITGMTCTSGD